MKKIFTYMIFAALVAVLFTSCRKETPVYDDNSYWLSQERGNVVYSSNYCGFYVVETNYGYTIVQSMDGMRIYDGDVLYGNFGGYGTREFYNNTANLVTRGQVMEYDLSYYEAQDAINYYCPVGKGAAATIKQSAGALNKVARPGGKVKE